jgi:hypothetical protein
LGQITSNLAPHSPQNFIPSGFSNWHSGHFIFHPKERAFRRQQFLPPKGKKLHPSVRRNGALENQQLGGIAKVPCIGPSYLNCFHIVKGKCRR